MAQEQPEAQQPSSYDCRGKDTFECKNKVTEPGGTCPTCSTALSKIRNAANAPEAAKVPKRKPQTRAEKAAFKKGTKKGDKKKPSK